MQALKFELSHAGIIRLAVTMVGVAMVLYHGWVIVAGSPEAIIFRGTHLMFALVLAFLIYGSKVGVHREIPKVKVKEYGHDERARQATIQK